MKSLNLCVDIDGTVTEPHYWLNRANRFFKTQVEPKDVRSYDIHEVLGVKRSAYDEFYSLFGKLVHKEARARMGAAEVLNKLYMRHRIHFVTAREERMKDVSMEWLSRHNFPMDTIALLGTCDKVGQARDLKCDLFIEDSLENARMLSEAGFHVLLIDCSYNKGALPFNTVRVNNWFQIEKIVEHISMETKPSGFAI